MTFRRKYKLLWHIFPIQFLIIVSALSIATYLATKSLKDTCYENTRHFLTICARMINDEVYKDGGTIPDIDKSIRKLADVAGVRITVISADGVVIADSDNNPADMDNHRSRQEIKESLSGVVGSSMRYSVTLKTRFMYVSVPHFYGNEIVGVVRTSLPVSHIDEELNRVYGRVAIGGILLVLLAGIISIVIVKKTLKPFDDIRDGAERYAKGELTKALKVPGSIELAALADTLNRMASELDNRIKAMDRQKKEMEAVFANMSEGVIAVDKSERIIEINDAACSIFGISISNSKGRSVQETIRNVGTQSFMSNVLEKGGDLSKEILLIDEKECYLEIHGSTLKGIDNQIIGALFVTHDISDIKKLEKIRKDFVANVSHELRTPITAIKGFVETLEDGALNDRESALDFLEIIHRQSDRMLAIIEDLLELARIEQTEDKKTVNKNILSAGEIVDTALETCLVKAAEKRIQVDRDIDEKLELYASKDLIVLALRNLIDNAIKYSENDNRILIKTRSTQESIVFIVKDFGIGIPREHMERIFERFYRVDKSRSRDAGGTGLGLSIVKHIANIHKGIIAVDSTPGEGSEFSLSIPRSDDNIETSTR